MTKVRPFILSIIILIFIQYSFPLATDAAPKYPEGTTIASLQIEGKTKEDTRLTLIDEVENWNLEETITVKSDLETFHIPRSAITFDIDATLNELHEKTKRTLANFLMRPKNVHVPLVVYIDEEDESFKALQELDHIDYDATIERLKEAASELSNEPVPLVYVNEDDLPFETIEQVAKDIPDHLSNAVISYTVNELKDFMILPDKSFSLLDSVTFPGEFNNSAQELSFIGSTLYELFLHTDVDIIEKNTPLNVPSYTQAGLAAEVDREQEKDLVVFNNDSIPLKIDAEIKDGQLLMSLETIRMENNYQYEVTQIEEIEPRTIYRYSNKLDPGEQEIIQHGQKGEKVIVERLIYKNKVFVDSESISEEVYLPVPEIIVVSAQEEEPVSEGSDIEGDSESIELDDMISDELDERSGEMRNVADEIDERIANGKFDDEDDSLYSSLLLVDFLEEFETFKEQIDEYDKRLEQIERELDTNLSEEYSNLIDYQKEIEKYIEELNRQYERMLELILNGEKGV